MLNYEVFVTVPLTSNGSITEEKVWIYSEQGLEIFLDECAARGWSAIVGDAFDPTDSRSAVDRILERLA